MRLVHMFGVVLDYMQDDLNLNVLLKEQEKEESYNIVTEKLLFSII